jgi:hypothetical protein
MSEEQILTELVIFARERGAEEDQHVMGAVRAAERRIDLLVARRQRRERLKPRDLCERCSCPSTSGLLCRVCLSEAPASIRNAFRNASGWNGICAAARRVRLWARGQHLKKAA